jgi:hypothetical protein
LFSTVRRGVAVAVLSMLAVAVSAMPALGAGTSYGGGGSGGGGGLPGLPGSVVTTCTFEGPPLTCTATIGAYTITVFAPANSLTIGSQLVITSVNDPGAAKCVLLTSFGVGNFINGGKVSSTFNLPLTVTVTGPGITSSTQVFQQASSGTLTVPVMAGTGSLVFSMPADPAYQVDNPNACEASTAITGATVAVTGKPFLGEELLAAVLIGFGSMLLLGLNVRRRRRTAAVIHNH